VSARRLASSSRSFARSFAVARWHIWSIACCQRLHLGDLVHALIRPGARPAYA